MTLGQLPPEHRSDPGRLPAESELTWLDEEHALEPLDATDTGEVGADDPIVLDAAGRMWRLRYRPVWTRTLTRAAPVLIGLVLLALLVALRV